MSEPTSDLAEFTRSEQPRGPDAQSAWRRRLTALRTNEFVTGLLKTCLLSVIACGPIPPVRGRRHR